MYYEAVKSAFGCFPLDPPRKLDVGDYVRISLGGKVHHYGNLEKLLEIAIDFDEHVSEFEYMSSAISKAGIGSSAPTVGEARIRFSSTPGLYLKGTRRVRRARDLDRVFALLSKAKVDWSFRNRIVVETHSVEHAELYCSGGQTAEIQANYRPNGVPVSIDASAALNDRQLLHLPNVTGTIAFSPVRILFGLTLGANARALRGYEFREMDVNDPDEYDPDASEDTI